MSALLYAVADIGPDRSDPRECFALVRDEIRKADIAFCQLEVNLTERGVRLPQVRHTHRASASTAAALKDAGFTVVSFSGNHCMDWGPEGFFDTIDNLHHAGLRVVGVGADIRQARAPVIEEANGVRVAFLAYNSILPANYWAEADRPGCAPMRAWTIYEQIEPDQPGTPCRVHTHANRVDVTAMIADIKAAREIADVVVMSIHWGIHFIPAVLADYQIEIAHAAIDAGVDLILGHHAHILKGIELYRGKPIFYSMGNFAIDLRMTPEHAQGKGFREIQALSPGWTPDFDSLYNFPPDSRMTLVVTAEATTNGLTAVGFLPTFINRDAQPEILKADDIRFGQVVDYLRWATAAAGLNARFHSQGDTVVLDMTETPS
jgi:poly-gamma-glutamate capsule biosynthesis protein CapA/YwtB (metallophosphatase superfamily)